MDEAAELDPAHWVERHGDSLYRFAVVRVQNPEVAADLVQETFLAALAARASFAGRSSVRTWLVGILKRKVIDRIRKSARERRFESNGAPGAASESLFDRRGHWQNAGVEWGNNPLAECERSEFWDVLEACLAKIPPHLAHAFLGSEIDGESRESLCEDLKITPQNLSVRLFRTRALLRRCLERNWFGIKSESGELPRAMGWAEVGSSG